MATHKRTSGGRKKAYRRILKFPQTKGKIIAEVELSNSPDYNNHRNRFRGQDLTQLQS
jgi:hypothetical protein